MEKTIAIRNTEITFSIWDLGGNQTQVLLSLHIKIIDVNKFYWLF